ncbi:hypothetical protein [Vibrio coralliilyticus]|uniref:hypothetical protein n=1 Tax=Vibrio coralliilyticus TaxID=190893 RepID=UPI001E61656A|nr:hypothetical protein [Vibrio coralliilyticus]MCC2525784.1 hypothetical protein [Vibrio coralliilyticus]
MNKTLSLFITLNTGQFMMGVMAVCPLFSSMRMQVGRVVSLVTLALRTYNKSASSDELLPFPWKAWALVLAIINAIFGLGLLNF